MYLSSFIVVCMWPTVLDLWKQANCADTTAPAAAKRMLLSFVFSVVLQTKFSSYYGRPSQMRPRNR